MKDCIAQDWGDLEELFFKDSLDPQIARHRSKYVFRGLPNAAYDLGTSLKRICINNLELEHCLLRNFKKYAFPDLGHAKGFWEIVSIAQHHGLPTRLLDWTFSPYVALHFANG